jgi:hypothetical protein
LLRIEINGENVSKFYIDASGLLKPGPIELLPGAQFANIFVRTKKIK